MPWTYVQPDVYLPDPDGQGWLVGVTELGNVYTISEDESTIYIEPKGTNDPFVKRFTESKSLSEQGVRNVEDKIYTYEQRLTEAYWSDGRQRWPEGQPVNKEQFLTALRATDDSALSAEDQSRVSAWKEMVKKIPPDVNKFDRIREGITAVESRLEEKEVEEQAAAQAEAQTKEAREAQIARLQKSAYERGQRQDLARALGPMALVGGIGSAIQVVSAFRPDLIGDVQDKYVAEELKKKPIGGLTGEAQAFMERSMMAPVRGLATERRKRREAEMAASGQRTSAAELERARTAEAQEVGRAAQITGAKIADANMKAAAQELQRREQMIAYQGQRQRGKLAQAARGAGQVASLVGAARAGKATPVMDPTKLIENLQDNKVPEEIIDDIVVDVEKAYRMGKPSRRRMTRILSDYDVNIEDLDQSVVGRLTGSDFARRQSRRQLGYDPMGGALSAPDYDPGGRLARMRDRQAMTSLFTGLESEEQEFAAEQLLKRQNGS